MIPGFSLDEASQSGWIMGTEEEIRQRIGDFAAAGAQRLMLQVFDMTRVDYIEKFARIIEPLGR